MRLSKQPNRWRNKSIAYTCVYTEDCAKCTFSSVTHFNLSKNPSLSSCDIFCCYTISVRINPVVCLVEGTFIIWVGICRAGSVPGSVVICTGQTQRATALLLVLETPAEERWFFCYLVRLLILLVMCQADHGVGLRQAAVCSALGGL